MTPDFDDGNRLLSGRLVHHAEVRTRTASGGLAVPVLCLDIETDTPARMPVHVEQPFKPGQHAQAEAAARRLKKGAHVTVQAPVLGWRLVVGNATHIHNHQPEEVTP